MTLLRRVRTLSRIFFFNDPPPTKIYTLSLHDALPIFGRQLQAGDLARRPRDGDEPDRLAEQAAEDRKSTRLNSSHMSISYAVFCLKKKKQTTRGFGALPAFADILLEISTPPWEPATPH